MEDMPTYSPPGLCITLSFLEAISSLGKMYPLSKARRWGQMLTLKSVKEIMSVCSVVLHHPFLEHCSQALKIWIINTLVYTVVKAK